MWSHRRRILVARLAVCLLALSLSASADRDDRPREAGPEDGFLCCNGVERFLFHGDKVLATTGRAGIFRSQHRGEGWQRSMEGLVAPNGVSPFGVFLCQARSEPRIVYALAGDDFSPFSTFNGLFSSDDFGATWTRRASVLTGLGFGICDVAPGDSRTVFVSGANQDFVFEVWKSTDGGRTVRQVVLPFIASFVDVRVVHGTLYVVDGDQGRVYASTDGGASFHPVSTPPGLALGFNVSPDGSTFFVRIFDEDFRPVGTFRSSDRGASYVAVSGLSDAALALLAFDPTDPSRIYAGAAGDGLLRVSNDGGLSFSVLPASDDPRFIGPILEIGVDDRGSVYLNTLGGPFRTDDGGRAFRSLQDGFRASAVNDLAFDAEGNLLVGVNNTRGAFQEIHGRNYRPIGDALPRNPFVASNTVVAVAGSPFDARVVLAATAFQGGVFRTDDGGRSWTVVSGTPTRFANTRMAFPTSERVYLVLPAPPAFQPGLYRSDDAGRSFARLSSGRFGALAVDPTNPDVLYVGTYNGSDGLFKSTDGGQTLQSLGQPGMFSALAVDIPDPQVIYAGEQFGQVIRSRDGGRTFAPASTGLAGKDVHGLAQDVRGTLFVWLRGGGLFASRDGASSWYPVDTGEALRRSGVVAGRAALVADPRRAGRVYLGNAGVLRIDAADDEDDDDE